jgi:hypothetical protein
MTHTIGRMLIVRMLIVLRGEGVGPTPMGQQLRTGYKQFLFFKFFVYTHPHLP